MATITTKYSIGDVVFYASTTTIRKKHPCPDCKGARRWKATSPAGGEYEFDCPRCTTRYLSDQDLALDYSQFAPSISRLTIGSVQYNTAIDSYDHGARYMCRETGVGSGSVYNEDRLFESEEAATVAAQALADVQNVDTEWVVKLYNKTLAVSDYQLDGAVMKLAKAAESRARSMIWSIGDLFGQIEEADDKDAILELVEDYRKYSWEDDKTAAAETEVA